MGGPKMKKEFKECLGTMSKLEEELEKAYAEENNILIKKLLEDLEEVNEKYATLRKERADCCK